MVERRFVLETTVFRCYVSILPKVYVNKAPLEFHGKILVVLQSFLHLPLSWSLVPAQKGCRLRPWGCHPQGIQLLQHRTREAKESQEHESLGPWSQGGSKHCLLRSLGYHQGGSQ